LIKVDRILINSTIFFIFLSFSLMLHVAILSLFKLLIYVYHSIDLLLFFHTIDEISINFLNIVFFIDSNSFYF
jgi:hypothetical protein